MKIPKKLKVMGRNIKIIYPYRFKERTDLLGQWDAASNTIRLASVDSGNQKISKSAVFIALLEEVMHAIDQCTGHRVFDNEDNHKGLPGICEGIYQVLLDNGYLK